MGIKYNVPDLPYIPLKQWRGRLIGKYGKAGLQKLRKVYENIQKGILEPDPIYNGADSEPCEVHFFDTPINSYDNAFVVITKPLLKKIDKIERQAAIIAENQEKLSEMHSEEMLQQLEIAETFANNKIENIAPSKSLLYALSNIEAAKVLSKHNMIWDLLDEYKRIVMQKPRKFEDISDIRKLYDEAIWEDVAAHADEPIEDLKLPDNQPFRDKDCWIYEGTRYGAEIQEKRKMRIPPEKIEHNMKKFIALINKKDGIPLVSIAVSHLLFEQTHPFLDGNGRTGRLITSQLLSDVYPTPIALALSQSIARDKNLYYKAFDMCDCREGLNDLTPFVNMFTHYVDKACEIALNAQAIALDNRPKTAAEFASIITKNPTALHQEALADVVTFDAQTQNIIKYLSPSPSIFSLLRVLTTNQNQLDKHEQDNAIQEIDKTLK